MRRLLRSTLLLLAASPALADVRVVAAAGAPYTTIQDAVNAASDGDVILVRPGVHAGFTIANKALDVVADRNASMPLVRVDGTVAIQALAATRTVTLSGFDVRGPTGAAGVRITSCTGAVRVHTCEVRGGDGPICVPQIWPPGGAALDVDSCEDVVVSRSTLRGGVGGTQASVPYGYGGRGGDGVSGRTSKIALYDSTLVGGVGGSQVPTPSCPNAYGYVTRGGEGATLSGCVLSFASRCSFQGGDGGVPSIDWSHGGDGLELTGAPGPVWSSCSVLDSTAAGGTGNCAQCAGVGYRASGPSVLQQMTGVARRLVAESIVREQNVTRLRFHGQPGDRVELLVSEVARYAFDPGRRGVQHLRVRAPSAVLQVGVLGASGVLETAWPATELGAGVEARRLFLQPQFVDASGQATLGTPHTLVLLDSAF